MGTAQDTQDTTSKGMRFVWVEYIKFVALFLIVSVHIAERVFGYEFIANQNANWPPIGERIQQLFPLQGNGLLDIPLNIFRYIGWSGDQGVQLFLIISGFGLTWGLLGRYANKNLPIWDFYKRRAVRIYPLWWVCHIVFLLLSFFLLSLDVRLSDYRFYASFLGIRITPSLLYYISSAWWYVGLLLQLYVIFPILWKLLWRLGVRNFLIGTLVISFAVRGTGMILLQHSNFLDAWSRGAIFITRLPEFVFGMALAYWFFYKPTETRRFLSSPKVVFGAVVAHVLGIVLALDLYGMTFAVFLLGASLFVVLYAILKNAPEPMTRCGRMIKWIGVHSFSIYLVHFICVETFVAGLFGNNIRINLLRVVVGTVAALIVTIPFAILLERTTNVLVNAFGRLSQRWGEVRAAAAVVCVVVAGFAALVGLELLSRQVVPQEVLGWGERVSLEPDTWVAWHLKPSTTTRLRWQTYDYTVTANALGFPGPDYPVEKSPNTFRIMVTGDAFSSAEGVDTDQSWPRVLNQLLSTQSSTPTEVMNFAITGYGPKQYAEVIQKYAPIYKPDLVIVEMFVNDYEDVTISDDDFRASIGFQLKPQNGVMSILGLDNLRVFLSINSAQRINEFLTGNPYSAGYFLGHFSEFARLQPDLDARKALVKQQLAEIQAVANQIHAPLMIVMVPSSIQVCASSELPYFPRYVDLSDTTQFDLDLPQRNAKAMADDLGIAFYDLRPLLSAIPSGCPYQPANMHWLPVGHQTVAQYMADLISKKQP